MLANPYIEIPLLLIPLVCCPLILYMRLKYERASNGKVIKPRGIGVRLIQLIAVVVVIPIAAILSIECKLTSEGTAVLFGAIVGFALSGVTEVVPSRYNREPEEKQNEKQSN